MLIKGDVKGKAYKDLIDYAFKKCDAAMFVIRKDMYINKHRIDNQSLNELKNLKNFIETDSGENIIKKRTGNYWVYSKVGNAQVGISEFNDPEGYEDFFEIFFIKTSDKLKKYLLSNNDLYNWLHTKYPEDVSFFKNGYCWLYSVAHEELCYIYCENKEEYEYLKSIGIEFVDTEYKETPQNELYYEEY